MRAKAFLAILVLAAALPAAGDEGAGDWEARLTQAKGTVTVYTAEEPEGVPGDEDLPLQAGDRVTTGADSSAELAFDGIHLIVLQSNSDFTLSRLERSSTEFNLSLGGLLARLQTLLSGQSARVRTPSAVVSMRGTEFGVEIPAENPEETHVGVFDDGKIEVQGGDGPPERLKANQETRVARGSRPMPAYQLTRLVRHRRFMRGYGPRARAVRQAWKSLPRQERVERRREALNTLRARRQTLMEQRRQRRPDRVGEGRPRPRVEDRPDRKKMEKRREAIRRRRQGP